MRQVSRSISETRTRASHPLHRLLALTAVSMLALTACGPMIVGAVAPRPTIDLAQSNKRLALVLSPRIADDFDVTYAYAHVTGFRRSVENGYAASIQRYFTRAGGDVDLTLRFESISIEMVSAGGGQMIVHFAARLDDEKGVTIGRSFGSLRPSRQYVFEDQLAEGLGMMFEKVAADCFVGRAGAVM